VDGVGGTARFDTPGRLAVDAAGNVYVGEYGNNTVRKITPAGEVATLAGLTGSPGSADGAGSAARFSGPGGVAVDAGGVVYVADQYNNTIRRITPAGVVSTLAGLAGERGGVDGSGRAARFNSPTGVAVDAVGNVYVADQYNDTIRRITPAGEVTTLAGRAGHQGSADGAGEAARFFNPVGVAVDGEGNVYVADQFNQTIRKIAPTGEVATLAGLAGERGSADGAGATARFNYPYGVAVDREGNVYVADTGNSTVRRITPAGEVTTLAGLAGNEGTTDGVASTARFNGPGGIAVDAAGTVFVADTYNDRISRGVPHPGNPRPATATATVVNGFVVAADITDGGCGYTDAPVVSFEDGEGEGASARAVVTGGVVVSLVVTSAGVGYTRAPEVRIAPPCDSPARAVRPRPSGTASPRASVVLNVSAAGLAPMTFHTGPPPR
jgi:hypothetical protein